MTIKCPTCARELDTLDPYHIPDHAHPATDARCLAGGAYVCWKCKKLSYGTGGRPVCSHCGTTAKPRY